MFEKLLGAWCRIPVLVRAPVAGFVILTIGTVLTSVPLLGNLKLYREIPWAFPATLVVLAGFWLYFRGYGFPASTAPARRLATRQTRIPGPLWRAAMPALLFSIMTLTSFRLLLPSILPVAAPHLAVNLSGYPLLTIMGLLLSLAISAGVTEEVALRGYVQKPLEDAYGIVPAILVTGCVFWLAHADKVTITHLPFHMLASVCVGLLAYYTRSLIPAIIGHAVTDALLQPAYVFQKPGFVWTALTAHPVWEGLGTTDVDARAGAVWQAMDPTLIGSASGGLVAALAWGFAASALATAIAFVHLARVAART